MTTKTPLVAHITDGSRIEKQIVILNEVKNQLVGVSVGITDSVTPGSILRRMILRYNQNDRMHFSDKDYAIMSHASFAG